MSKRNRIPLDSLEHRFFASCALGFENILQDELLFWAKGLSFESIQPISLQKGGVEFQGSLTEGLQLNDYLKTSHRILLRIRQFKCKDFERFQNKMVQIPWNQFVGLGPVEFRVASHKSRLFHKRNIAEVAEGSLKKAFKGQPPKEKYASLGGTFHIRFEEDICTLSVDTSGENAYKRGYKTLSVDAPVRETLASGMLLYTLKTLQSQGIYPKDLIDPMCGSGTFIGEAHRLYLKIDNRPFSYKSFPLSASLNFSISNKLSRKKEAEVKNRRIINRQTPRHKLHPVDELLLRCR